MRHLFLLFNTLTFVTLLSTVALAQSYNFEVSRNGTTVGQCAIAFEKRGELTKVTYRMNIVVRILGIAVYRLDSHQIALFNREGALLAARTKANIDGTPHEVAVLEVGDSYEVTHNGAKKTVLKTSLAATTLDPVFQLPRPGMWLDLTDGQVLPYTVTKHGDHIELGRPDGRDLLFTDSTGVIRRIESFVSKGSLVMTRASSPLPALPPLVSEEPPMPPS